jgi:hypothetical protein
MFAKLFKVRNVARRKKSLHPADNMALFASLCEQALLLASLRTLREVFFFHSAFAGELFIHLIL